MNLADLLLIAISIVEHCADLPLKMVTIASGMRAEYNIPIWRNALVELSRNIPSIIDIKDMVHQQMRFSYD